MSCLICCARSVRDCRAPALSQAGDETHSQLAGSGPQFWSGGRPMAAHMVSCMSDTNVNAIPEGFHSLTPSLTVRDAAGAIEFYKRAFGAVELSRAAAPDGTSIWHAELQIGDSRLMLNDEFPDQGGYGPPATGAVGFAIWVYVEDVDAVFARAVEAGAQVKQPLVDGFWGDRFGGLQDPYGHNWSLATRKENVSEEESRRRAEAFSG